MSNASSSPQGDKNKPPEVSKKQLIPLVPWNPWLAVLFLIILYYGSQFLSGVLVSIYPYLQHWSDAETQAWLADNVAVQFIFIALAEAIIVLGIFWFLRMYRVGFAKIGLVKPRWMDLAYGFAAVPAYFVFYFITVAVFSYLVPSLDINQEQQIGFESVQGGAQLFMVFISLVVLPPIVEEIMVRGFLYSSLKKAMPTIGAVILTSAIFASAHLPEGGAAGPLYIAAIDTFVLSLFLIYLREKTGSLWPSITLHAVKNGIAFVALFAFHLR